MDGPRGLKEQEFPSAAKLDCTVFQLEKFGITTSSLDKELPLLFSKKNFNNLRVFVDAGEVVSLVGISIKDIAIMGCRTRVASIGGVCTHPEYRNRGLATRLMEDATRRALEERASVMLISGGRSLYRRLGCIDAGLYNSYLIKRDQLKVHNEGLIIREHDEGDIVELVRLHQTEPLRFIRPYEDFKEVLAVNRLCVRSSKTYIISSEKRILAYVCLQLPEAKEKPLIIRELAGSREVVLKTLRALMDDVGTGFAIIETPSADVTLEHLLLSSGAKKSDRRFMGTVKLIDVQRFFQDMDDYIVELIGTERRRGLSIEYDTKAQDLSFEYGEKKFRIHGIDKITAFVFGSAEVQCIQPEGIELKSVLNTLFPMPLVDYGLNYV